MTRITFYQNAQQELRGFEARDHAGYGEAGEDIVCAAASALTINCVNSLQVLTKDEIFLEVTEEPPRILVKLEETCSAEAELLLSSYALGIRSMLNDETSSAFVDVRFEEV